MEAPLRRCALAIALASLTTFSWSHTSDPPKPEAPKGTVIRTDVKLEKPKNKGHGKPGMDVVSAVVVVDLAGNVLGRYWERNVLLQYEDGLLQMPIGNESVYDPTVGRSVSTGYFTWTTPGLYFTTPNCTGTPHLAIFYTAGTKYAGAAIRDTGSNNWTAYVFSYEQSQILTMYSSASYDWATGTVNCLALNQGFTEKFAPVIDTFSLQSIGTPPFMIR